MGGIVRDDLRLIRLHSNLRLNEPFIVIPSKGQSNLTSHWPSYIL